MRAVLDSISLRGALFGLLLFVVTFAISLAIVSFIMVKIPPHYFRSDYSPEFLTGRHPVIRLLGLIGKNILGVLLVALGIVMSVPGVPGQGLLTILLGVMLLDFPGRRNLEAKLVSRPGVFKTINKLRHRFGKPDLVLD
ncbi:MAG TPA: hypothetical protein VMS31_07525 [Pyrinomonadaceae bacterium]|nr:hypothetical protein [Pyrinomonadaceae bacterium]